MKILVCEQPGSFAYDEFEMPQPAAGQTLLAIKRVGICGTDLHAYEGTQPFFNYPRILGHELAATIDEVGDANGFTKGEAVTIVPYFHCGECIACRSGKPNCCVHIKVFGVHGDGGMREYVSVPSYALVHGDGLSYDELALVEPLAIGAHGVRRADVQPGEFVLVIGAGPIGLGTMEFARIAGAQLIAMDVNESRLQFCRGKLNIPHTVNALDRDVLQYICEMTNGDMPTVIIDATGNQKAINGALQYLAHGGRYVLIGLQKNELIFSHPEFHKRETTMMSSRNATRADFEHVIASMKKGLVDPVNYITHRVGFDRVKNEFAQWLDPKNGVIKAMVAFD